MDDTRMSPTRDHRPTMEADQITAACGAREPRQGR
jgi:hypothetical protein